MQPGLAPDALLTLWERALGQRAGTRGAALLRAASDDALPARTMGEANARLMKLHAQWFGRSIDLVSHCPACATASQFDGDCEALAAHMWPTADGAQPHRLEVQGHVVEFRVPDSDDVALAAVHDDADPESGDDAFARHLLDRCVLDCTRMGERLPVRELPPAVLDALSQRMELLDPGASVSFAVACPQCAATWQAPLDVGEMVWLKVRAAAERVLLDVDTLARAYGWTEREVLRLSPLRRAAYLQMVAS